MEFGESTYRRYQLWRLCIYERHNRQEPGSCSSGDLHSQLPLRVTLVNVEMRLEFQTKSPLNTACSYYAVRLSRAPLDGFRIPTCLCKNTQPDTVVNNK